MSDELFPIDELKRALSPLLRKQKRPRRKKHVVTYHGEQLELFQVEKNFLADGDQNWEQINAYVLCQSKAADFYWVRYKHRIARVELPKVTVERMSERERANRAKYYPETFGRRAA